MSARIVAALAALAVAGCSSSGTARSGAAARLIVHVTLSGGPMRPDGGMALSDSPDVGDVAIVTGGGRSRTVALDRDGRATLVLRAGTYRVSAGNCPARRRVELGAGTTVSATLHCDVP